MRFPLTLVLPSLLLLAACGGPKSLTISPDDGGPGKTVMVEIADTPDERTEGLMNRTELKHDTGMLFVFVAPEMLNFWMKDTKVPLDIMYFDKDGNFVNGLTMEPCTEDPCPGYKAASLAQYALEMPKGFRADNKIGVGWRLNLAEVKKMSKPK